MRVTARKEDDAMIVNMKRPELGQMDLRVEASRDRGQVSLVATRKAGPDGSGMVLTWTRTFVMQAACRMCSVLTGCRLKAKLYDVELGGYALERAVPEEATAAAPYEFEFRLSDITSDGHKLLFALDADEAAALSLALQAAVQKAMEAMP